MTAPTTRTQSQKIFYPNPSKPLIFSTSSTISSSKNYSYDYHPVDHSFNSSFNNKENKTTENKEPIYSSNVIIQKPAVMYNTKNINSEKNKIEQVTKKMENMNISSSSKVFPDVQILNKSHMPSHRFVESNECQNIPQFGRSNNIKQTTVANQKNVTAPVDEPEECVPTTVKNNLKKLISQYPDGLWCAELPGVYRKMFRRELKYQDLGFRNLIDLCISLKTIFHYIRPSTEDYKLYDRSKPLPDSAETVFTVASFSNTNKLSNQNNNVSALPGIGWSDIMSFLPADVFKPGNEIPRTFVPKTTKEDDTIDVMMGEIFDISKFWIYRDDGQLDKLMDEMQSFYNEHANDYILPKYLIREGVYCTTIIYGEYHRALIVDTMSVDEDMIRVFFIDYGTMAKVKPKLYLLHENFAKLPAQTIRCRLANICPPEKGAPWSQECIKEFKELIKNRNLIAKICRINWNDQFLEVFLADVTESQNVFYINSVLVEKGYAVYAGEEQKNSIIDALSTPIVKLIHLFPTFLELEHGLAPSTFEMEIYNECNTPINFCYPQYFFFDYTEEENIIKHMTTFYEKSVLRGLRKALHHHDINLSKCKQKIDMSLFGDLEEEMRAYLKEDKEIVDDFENEAANTNTKETDISSISKKIEMWKNQTVAELQHDCRLSEDIVKDLLNNYDVNSKQSSYVLEKNESLISEATSDTSVVLKSQDSDEEIICCNEGRDEESDTYLINHPLLDLTFSRSNSLCSVDYDENESLPHMLNETNKSDISDEETDESHTNRQDCEGEARIFNLNNPFLTDINLDSEQTETIISNNGRLHPSNPFLSYIPRTNDDNADQNSDSTSSTDYGTCLQEVQIKQTCSTIDHFELIDMSSSHYTDSIDSASAIQHTKSVESVHTTPNFEMTQPKIQEATNAPVVSNTMQMSQSVRSAPLGCDVTQPEFYPQNYVYPNFYNYSPFYPHPCPTPFPSVTFNNPYYNYAQQQYNSQVFMKSTVVRNVCPPPGFESNANCNPPNVDIDFYEAYNQTLKQRYGH